MKPYLHTHFMQCAEYEEAHQLFAPYCERIIAESIERVRQYLTISHINTIVCYAPEDCIPSMRVGGNCPNEYMMFMNIDGDIDRGVDQQFVWEFTSNRFHELHHMQRRETVWYGLNKKDVILTEWLACLAEHELCPHVSLPYIQATQAELSELKELLRTDLDEEDWKHHAEWFFGAWTLPNRAGYKLWFALAQQISHATGKSAWELVNTPTDQLIIYL